MDTTQSSVRRPKRGQSRDALTGALVLSEISTQVVQKGAGLTKNSITLRDQIRAHALRIHAAEHRLRSVLLKPVLELVEVADGVGKQLSRQVGELLRLAEEQHTAQQAEVAALTATIRALTDPEPLKPGQS